MPSTILGLDIGGANLKAATPDKRAVSVPFALWKQPDKLPAALADLVARFSDAEELAVTMTGELCDCYETRREGVNAIIKAVQSASGDRRIRVWSTDGVFVDPETAAREYLKVASANWHALAMFAGTFAPNRAAVLIDIGSTTTDVIPILNGTPVPKGKTDTERLESRELIYIGIRRTPIAALDIYMGCSATEFFATTLDAYLHLGLLPESPSDTDTADGRPATRAFAFDRLCRMFCGDRETIASSRIDELADIVAGRHLGLIYQSYIGAGWRLQMELMRQSLPASLGERPAVIASGAGEFLLTSVKRPDRVYFADREIVSLTKELGPQVSACAPAHAIAVLMAENRTTDIDR